MDERTVRELLARLKRGEVGIQETVERLQQLPAAELGFATVDHHRALRQGLPEVILGESKSIEQIVGIAGEVMRSSSRLLVTRVDPAKAERVVERLPELEHRAEARILRWSADPIVPRTIAPVAIVTAGTSDIPVAEEAAETLSMCAVPHVRVFDVGVAGIHRVVRHLELLHAAPALIVVAGMEGALASVVGGLVRGPIIAVPTSIGYGAALGGFTALMGMLSGCAAGVSVVNIDNGFGAAMAVHRIVCSSPAALVAEEAEDD